MLKKVLKFAPKTVEVAEAVTNDSAIITANTIKDGGSVSIIKDLDFTPDNVIDAETSTKEIEEKATEKTAEKALNDAFDNPAKVTPEEEKAIDEQFAKQQEQKFEQPDIF